ncbi:Hypothetical protein LCA_1202 [Latilactobacillus sakei subsp. sakei 23K]|uniref:Uncharacterized protein n=1 Tax=Latilactobacillus sakei subsp. sakei (strain 23K) TaxID=314315 RepID=Q38WC6_LATSS|nr:hypothetical protein [Latilactobacillus sakei]AUX12126.1 hypothetical protein C0213_06750 [Latilactobacillus sakei]CAI55506.1 Hypothetical protein LCA_1202 [Latilactobacillus sakei subsp. sakei 23K]
MRNQHIQLSAEDYVIQWNRFLEQFIVFETVFSEYTQTSKNITRGKKLVGENLQLLSRYSIKNLAALKRFVEQVHCIEPPSEFSEVHTQLRIVIDHYVQAAEDLIAAIGQHDGAQLLAKLETNRQIQKRQCYKINQLLNHIGTLKAEPISKSG